MKMVLESIMTHGQPKITLMLPKNVESDGISYKSRGYKKKATNKMVDIIKGLFGFASDGWFRLIWFPDQTKISTFGFV